MDLIVGMILSVCMNDHKPYYIQDEIRGCKQFYLNCIVTKNYEGASDEDALKACKDESKTKIAK